MKQGLILSYHLLKIIAMKISDDKKLRDLQNDFQSVFPFLKIEFFRLPHQKGEQSDECYRISPEKKVAEIRYSHSVGFLTLNGEMTVADFEQKMKEIFAVNTQVYRKEGETWQQIWETDDWTLHEHNKSASLADQLPKKSEKRGALFIALGSWFLVY